jgi:hypothetical protein
LAKVGRRLRVWRRLHPFTRRWLLHLRMPL